MPRRIVYVPLELVALTLMFLALPLPARADTVYTYHSNSTYTQCQEAYVLPGSQPNPVTGTNPCNGSISLNLSFTTSLSGSQLDNLVTTFISYSVTAFDFSDEAPGSAGFLEINQNTAGSGISVLFTTDSTGLPTEWGVSGTVSGGPASVEMCASSESRSNTDCTNRADNISYVIGSNPAAGWYPTVGWNYQLGSWTMTNTSSAVPEPGSLGLFGSGLAGVIELIRRKDARRR